MSAVLFGLSVLSLVIWCVLLFARGGFWRTRCAPPLSREQSAAIEAWPAVVAVVPARNEADAIGANSFLVKPADFDNYTELARVLSQYWTHLVMKPEPQRPPRKRRESNGSAP